MQNGFRQKMNLMQHLTATLTKAEISVQEESGEDTKYIDADPFVRNFSYTVRDDKIYYREGAVMRECNPNAASAERIRKLVELRDTTRALIDGLYQPWLYGVIGEELGGLLASLLQCIISFWVFYPIFKLIFPKKTQKN